MGRMLIWKSCFCGLRIILYIILFGQVNWTSFSLELNLDYIWTMSFPSWRDVHYLIDQFHYWLLISSMKTPALLKHHQFEDSGSDKIELRGSRYQYLDERDNEEGNDLDDKEGNGLDEYEGEIEGDRYVPSPFVPLSPLFRKVSNRWSDLGKRIRSLKYIVCIPKICYSRSANFAFEFPGRGGSKAQKKIYTSRLWEGLESHSASTASIASGITNHRCLIREHLESHPPSNYHQDLGTQLCANQQQDSGFHPATNMFNLFTNAFNIPKVTFLPTKAPTISLSL